MMHLKNNDRIGSWKLSNLLGSGGQGQVWKVRPTGTDHAPPRALKICLSPDAKARQRFAAEIEILKRYRHQGVMPIHDDGEFDATDFGGSRTAPYYVMEYAIGPVTSPELRADARQLLVWFREACSAVAWLHAQTPQVLHRDIKPSNLLVLAEGRRLVVADFGISVEVPNIGNLTATAEVVGSLVYRAPEVAYAQPATVQSDIYSLGRVLECLITGREPTSHVAVAIAAGHAGLTQRAADAISMVVRRATDYEPARRYASVDELLGALPELVVDLAEEEPPATDVVGMGADFVPGKQPDSTRARVPFRPGGDLGHTSPPWGGPEERFRWAGDHATPFAYVTLEETCATRDLTPLELDRVAEVPVPRLDFPLRQDSCRLT